MFVWIRGHHTDMVSLQTTLNVASTKHLILQASVCKPMPDITYKRSAPSCLMTVENVTRVLPQDRCATLPSLDMKLLRVNGIRQHNYTKRCDGV